MCGKHVAERPRRRIRATVLVTACVLAVEFVFLTWLYHFDDGAQERSEATARASVALAGWHPGEDPAPVAQELEALADSGVADADQLRTLTSAMDRERQRGGHRGAHAGHRGRRPGRRCRAALGRPQGLADPGRRPAPRLVGLVRLVPAPGPAPPRRAARDDRAQGHRRRRAPTARVGAQQHGRRGGDRAGLDRHVPLTCGGRPGLVARGADRTAAARDRVPPGPADARQAPDRDEQRRALAPAPDAPPRRTRAGDGGQPGQPVRRHGRPRLGAHRPRHHRAQAAAGGPDDPGLPRLPDRAGEPAAVLRPRRPRPDPARGAALAPAGGPLPRPRRLQGRQRQPRPRERRRRPARRGRAAHGGPARRGHRRAAGR